MMLSAIGAFPGCVRRVLLQVSLYQQQTTQEAAIAKYGKNIEDVWKNNRHPLSLGVWTDDIMYVGTRKRRGW